MTGFFGAFVVSTLVALLIFACFHQRHLARRRFYRSDSSRAE
jgi:hypothetical protein